MRMFRSAYLAMLSSGGDGKVTHYRNVTTTILSTTREGSSQTRDKADISRSIRVIGVEEVSTFKNLK